MKMKMKTPITSAAILFIFLSIVPKTLSIPLHPIVTEDDHHQRTFIVHVARSQKPSIFTSHHHWYSSFLNSLNHPPPKLLYTYEKAIHGFSATLTPSQATKLESLPGILSVIRGKTHKLVTTHTYKFLGLSEKAGLWPNSDYGVNVIIGVIDTGVWPEHRSFSDAGLSPVPSSWKGQCETSPDFPASFCNNKIIGARAFYVGDSTTGPKTVRDNDGHGSHVASIAAGSVVTNSSYYGFAAGEAHGVAPKARIAVYKVCPFHHCEESDILAGIDQAIADEVDVISFSIAGGTEPYYEDNFAVATFGAMQRGIVFSTVAGNEGPETETVNHLAPWALTVGASSVNREFRADVALGDGRSYFGESLYYQKPLSRRFYGLAYAAKFGNGLCEKGKFVQTSELAGKIIFCDGGGYLRSQSEAVLSVNGVGMIVTNTPEFGEELQADTVYYAVPTTMVSQLVGREINKYIKKTLKPKAYIAPFGTVIGEWPTSPKVAAFSSRGPNPLTPQILKPDLIAPGLNILGAWTGAKSPTMSSSDPRRVEFNVQSGSSMACPHVSGLAALLRSAHPNWSTSAIKSALMTTSYDLDNFGSPITDLATEEKSTPFVHGAGHVDPNRVADPGLIYDMGVNDYVAFLCSIGYDSDKIKIFMKEDVSSDVCDGVRVSPGDLNYPSFSVVFDHGNDSVTYRRAVTNVGDRAEVVYKVRVKAPKGVEIIVSPKELVFNADSHTNTYNVTFRSSGEYSESAEFGLIEWSDEEHRVRSSVACSWTTTSPTSSHMPFSTM